MSNAAPNVVNIDEAEEVPFQEGDYWAGPYKKLTPALEPRMGRLGVNLTRVPPGKSACPFHAHQVEDEAFFVLSGRGVFRHGETLREIRPGDCIFETADYLDGEPDVPKIFDIAAKAGLTNAR